MGAFKRITYIFALSLFLFVSDAKTKTPPPGSGSADVPANILLMLDTSGSMGELLPGPDSEYPADIAFDSSGNMYVAKYYDYIDKYDSSGNYLLSWGGGGSSNGKFDIVYSIAIDSNDNIYVSDRDNSRVQKFTTSGTYVSKFNISGGSAYGLDVDASGNIYVANGNGDVQKFNSSGTLLQTWDTSNARWVAVDDANSKVYVSRNSTQRIMQYDMSGNVVSFFNLSWNPLGIEVDSSGNLYIGRTSNNRVYKYEPDGDFIQYWGGTGSALGYFNSLKGLQIRPSDGKVYVADFNNHRIQSITGDLLIYEEQKTRLEAMQSVIKAIVTDSDLTSGANFGLMTWNSAGSQQMRVNISSAGASQIYSMIDTLNDGGSTYLAGAMSLAQSYFTGASSPMNAGASCQQNILIVVSDGYWFDNPDPTAQALYDNYGIKTFAVGFTTTGSANYTSLAQAGGSYPDSPLFAEDESSLLDALADYIRQIISSQLSFTVPTIIPGITNADHILQSTFLFKEDHQWKGHLYKYALQADGTMGSLVWDSGEQLNQTPAANRNIWTVANALTHSINNFTTSSIERLRVPLSENASSALSDTALESLIDFIRGVDSYGEYPTSEDDDGDTLLTGERWKLADIYHSKAVAVGAPSAYFSDEASSKSESYYRYVNGYKQFKEGNSCGGTCSTRNELIYVGSNSGMLHAFDSTTGDESWAFIPPGLLPNLKGVISSQASKSISIYGVDGSPAVKDIKIGNDWKTVLLGGLRQGGSSYYALDITDPDSPTHLFSFAYNKTTNKINYWDSSSQRTDYTLATVPSDYDYSALGESWSNPLILNIPIGSTKKWVGVFGGGYNNNVVGSYGSAVYVIDLEDGGKVLQKITLSDSSSTNGIINSVVPRLTAVTADSTTSFTHAGAMIYFNDIEGSMWKINLTDSGTLYEKTRVFNAESTYDNDRLCFHELSSTVLSDGRLMNIFGTADMTRIGRISGNIANRGYGVIDPNYPSFTSVSSPFTVSTMADVTSAGAICPTSTQNGWYINLGTNEKITAAATVRSGNVVFSRYTPDSNNICDSGTSKISEHDFGCGSKLRETNLGAGMATEAIVYKDKMYIGISSDAADEGTLPTGFVKQGNLIIGSPVTDSETSVEIQYWKEDF